MNDLITFASPTNEVFVGDVQDKAILRCKEAGIENARLEADLIVSSVTGIDRVTLFAHPEIKITAEMAEKIDHMLSKRIAGYPLAYLIGEWEFYGIRFAVREGVLVPRSDTETLVECAIELLDGKESNVADLGCGSGCICVALASAVPGLNADACDISKTAVELTKRNAEKQNLNGRVKVYEKDMFDALRHSDNKYDAILSNPPYIETESISSLQPEISLHEPVEALDGGSDGLKFYPQIFASAMNALKNGGFIAVEVGAGQANAVKNLAEEAGFEKVHTVVDLAGIERVVIGYKCPK